MGRSTDSDGGRRGHFSTPGSWIVETWAGDAVLDPSLFSSGVLLGGHGACPEEVDPLVDLPHAVEALPHQAQLDAIEAVYGAEIMHGLGLQLISLARAEFPWQWRLQEKTEEKIAAEVRRRGDIDFDTLILLQLRLYGAREAQLHWACEALGWPGGWVLGYLHHSGSERFDYGPSHRSRRQVEVGAFPPCDPDLEKELWSRHGLCPETVEPLRGLDALISRRSRAEQLAELERRYRPWARRRAAIEEFLAGEETERGVELADQLREMVRECGISSADAMRRVFRESSRLEAQIVWAAQALGLEASSLVTYLNRRVAAEG